MSLETSVICEDLKLDTQTSVVIHSNVFQEIVEDFVLFDYLGSNGSAMSYFYLF